MDECGNNLSGSDANNQLVSQMETAGRDVVHMIQAGLQIPVSAITPLSNLPTLTIASPTSVVSVPVVITSTPLASTPVVSSSNQLVMSSASSDHQPTLNFKQGLPAQFVHIPSSSASLSPVDIVNRLKEISHIRQIQEDEINRMKLTQKQMFEQKLEPCVVCSDRATGRHYGVISCEGCKGFFKRSIRKQLGYACRGNRDCIVNKHHRNRCQFCRLQKCLSVGMRTESVQQERKPSDMLEKSPISSLNTASRGNQRIYIRRDLGSPSASKPIFSLSKSTELLLSNLQNRVLQTDNGAILVTTTPVTSLSPMSTDLSTLANVVTSLATIEKEGITDEAQNDQIDNRSSVEGDTVAKAFGTLASRIGQQPQSTAAENENLDGQVLDEDENTDFIVSFTDDIVSLDNVEFTLTTPSTVPTYLDVHYICESASRLLFLSMHWTRSLAAFQVLSQSLQVTLVRTCWCQLFALGLAQCSDTLSLPQLLDMILINLQQDKSAGDKITKVIEHIVRLQELIAYLRRLALDQHEYAYMKCLILFSTDNLRISNVAQVECFQTKVLNEFQNYVKDNCQTYMDRLCRILLKLPALFLLNTNIIEELFFSGLIGHVQIDSIIPHILRMETSDYNSQMSLSSQSSDFLTQDTQDFELEPSHSETQSLLPDHSNCSIVKSETLSETVVSSTPPSVSLSFTHINPAMGMDSAINTKTYPTLDGTILSTTS